MFAAAFAAASWVYRADTGSEAPASTTELTSSFDAGLPVGERIAALEGVPLIPGLARRLFALYDGSEERLLLDASLQPLHILFDELDSRVLPRGEPRYVNEHRIVRLKES